MSPNPIRRAVPIHVLPTDLPPAGVLPNDLPPAGEP